MRDAPTTYFEQSRRLTVGLILVLPLLLVYEVGIVLYRSHVVNHAGALVRRMIGLFGVNAFAVLTAGVVAVFVLALLVKKTGRGRRFSLYWLMIVEAAIYGALLGPVARTAGARLFAFASPGNGLPVPLTALLYVGAGVWEEIVFRLVLLGGGVWLAVRVFRGNRIVFTILVLLVSSAAFSAFHHLGLMAEPFDLRRFLFRLLAGVALGVVYLLRGLGVCVYTHAFYNVALLLW